MHLRPICNCYLYVQTIAGHQRRLEDPSIDERMRAALEFDVQEWEEQIEQCKGKIASAEANIQELRRSLSVTEGEPITLPMA